MSQEIHPIEPSEADDGARLDVLKSMSRGYAVSILRFGPMRTRFGTRLNVALTEGQIEKNDDPGSFLDLTFQQAMDLNAKLSAVLNEEAQKRR